MGVSSVSLDSEDLFSEIAAIRHRSHEGRGDIESLVRLVGHPHRAMADAAREALAALAPMAALPERWTPVPHDGPRSAEGIPAWLVESCADWGTDSRLVQACVAELARSSGEERQRLLAQLAELPGLSHVLETALRARDPSLAEAQQEMLAHVHHRRFPLQINLAPTLACQLTCAYCVSAGVEARGDTTRSWSDLLAILDWARARGVRRVGLTGGEPTLYPRFHDLLREIGLRKLELYLATNGLLSEATLGRLVEARPLGVSLHLAPEVRAESRRWARFRRTAEACVDARINVALRVNLVSPTDDVEELAAAAAELRVNEIRAAVPIPNAGRRNAFVTVASLADHGQLIDRLLTAARRKGVPVVLCKPFPVCALPERSATSRSSRVSHRQRSSTDH